MDKFEGFPKSEAEKNKEAEAQISQLTKVWKNISESKSEEKSPDFRCPEDASVVRKYLYDEMIDSIKSCIDILGIKENQKLIAAIDQEQDDGEKSKLQIEFLNGLADQFRVIPHERWSFYPKQIKETKTINCSGGALLSGYMSKQAGIETYDATAVGHAANVVRLADGAWFFFDARNGVVAEMNNPQIEKVGDVSLMSIRQKDILYNALIAAPIEYSVGHILNNLDCLRFEAQRYESDQGDTQDGKDHDADAYYIYSTEEEIFSGVRYREAFKLLYPDIVKSENSEVFSDDAEWQEKIKMISPILRGILKRFEEEKVKKMKNEILENRGDIWEIIRSGGGISILKGVLSDETIDVLIEAVSIWRKKI